MVGPVVQWQQRVSAFLWPRDVELLAVSLFYCCSLILVPALLVCGTAILSSVGWPAGTVADNGHAFLVRPAAPGVRDVVQPLRLPLLHQL